MAIRSSLELFCSIASAMYALTLGARPSFTARRALSAARSGRLTAIFVYRVIPVV
jgi:hypothetical protein